MAKKTKNNDPLLKKVKKGLRYVESSGGLKMINPNSSATGLYGQLYNAEELQNMPYLQGVDRQSFASDTTLQNRLFEDRYFGKIPGVPGLGRNANDLRVEYKKVLEDKGIPFNYTDDEISALSNLLGRQGTREYFGYVLRDGRSLADVFPKIYGPDAETPNKTPEKYLETYREGRDLKYGGQVRNYQNGGLTDPPIYNADLLNVSNLLPEVTVTDQLPNTVQAYMENLRRTNPIAYGATSAQNIAGQTVTDIANFLPGSGEAIDAGYAADALSQGNYGDAALYSAGFMLPFVPGKAIKKGLKEFPNLLKVGKRDAKAADYVSSINPDALDLKSIQGLTQNLSKGQETEFMGNLMRIAQRRPNQNFGFNPGSSSISDLIKANKGNPGDYRNILDVTRDVRIGSKNIYDSELGKNLNQYGEFGAVLENLPSTTPGKNIKYVINRGRIANDIAPTTKYKSGFSGDVTVGPNYLEEPLFMNTSPDPIYNMTNNRRVMDVNAANQHNFLGGQMNQRPQYIQSGSRAFIDQGKAQASKLHQIFNPRYNPTNRFGDGLNIRTAKLLDKSFDVPNPIDGTFMKFTDYKYGGNMNKYKNGGDPPKKHKDYLQYNPNYPFTGWVDSPYSYERLQNRITEDSLLLQDSWFPSNELMRNLQINREYRDKVRPYTKEELYDLKYEGDQSKAYGGRAIPQAGFGDMFKKLGQQIKTGLTGAVEGVTGGLVPATKLLRPELRQTYADEMKMGNLFGSTVGFLGGAGLFSGAGAANAATSAAGMSSVPGANTFNALYGSGINPAMMNPSLAGQASTAGASGFGNLFNLGSNFGVGNTASGMFNIYQQGQEGFAMGGRVTNPPFMSAMNRPKDVFTGPLAEPNEKINALKSEIARLEESFNSAQRVQTARGSSSFTPTMRGISSQAIKAQEELKRLTGKNYAQGGKATNMKQDMGQDINVESGELLMSAEGGQFQSMNPKAPIKEVMPGVSLVQGNQSNDNVPLKLPDGETMVFSKRLGYADKGLELVNQYKELEKTPDSNDFIGQQTKKFQLKRIKDKLQKLFREQERSKSKKIAKKTGNPQIPGAGLGDLFTKAKGFLQSDGFKQFGNKALEFAKDNPEAIYNMGQGLFAKDIPQIDASQYMTQFEPDPSLTKIDMGALMAPIRNQVASSQYNILRGGGSPAEKIAASMQLSGKAGSQLAAQEAKGQMLQNQLGLNIFERQAEIDRNNKMLALRLDMMNEQRGAARDMFFKEAVSDMGQYQTSKRGEEFMADLYNQRFGTPTTTGGNAGTGTGFNFSLGNMSQPSLGNFGLFDNYQGLNQ